MKNSVNAAKFINGLLIVLAIGYMAATVFSLVVGGVEPFGFLTMATLPLAMAKGANKVKKLPFDVFDAETKGGKAAHAIRIAKEGSEEIVFQLRMLCTAANVPFFSWPSKNVDKDGKKLDGFVTYGTMPSGLEIVTNYETLNFQDAKEIGAKIKANKVAEREAKKAAKATKGETVASKIAAFRAMYEEGIITKEQFGAKVLELA